MNIFMYITFAVVVIVSLATAIAPDTSNIRSECAPHQQCQQSLECTEDEE